MLRLEARQKILNQREHFAHLRFIFSIHGVLLLTFPNIKNWDEIGGLIVQGRHLTFEL